MSNAAAISSSFEPAIVLNRPLVASPNQAMMAIGVSRKKLYELINNGELASYTEGTARRITVKSIAEYVERRLAAEAQRRAKRGGSAA